jgi:hypothetical protein
MFHFLEKPYFFRRQAETACAPAPAGAPGRV